MMSLSVTLLLIGQNSPRIDVLNKLAGAKDIAKLSTYSAGDGSEFKVMRGGAYGVGNKGWSALELSMPGNREFVVFTTPLTSQDIGELLFERKGTKLAYISETRRNNLQITFQKLDVEFNILAKEVQIRDEVTLDCQGSSPHGFQEFRMSPCYRVTTLSEDGKSVPFKQVGGIVMFPQLTPGKHTFQMAYKGIVNLPGYAGSITPENATLTNDYWYPMINRMPCAYEISIKTPRGFTTVAQGKKLEEKPTPDGTIVRYRMDLPVIYWSLTTAKLQQKFDKFGNLSIGMWSPRVPAEQMEYQGQLYDPILRHFSAAFAPFPFESYGGLDSPTYGGGALEAYSFATYGGGLPAEDAHEPAHTWWGGILNNTYLKSFWNESFAVWSDRFYNQEVAIGNRLERQSAFVTVCAPDDDYNSAPLMKSGAEIGSAAASLGYGKGAYVLEMLEQLVGTNNLTECMREWISVHPKGQPAEWEDFEKVILRKLGSYQLKSFFDDWFRRPGYASFELLSASFSGETLSGRMRWNGPSFRMPIELWLEDKSGQYLRINLDTKNVSPLGEFSLKVIGFKPTRVYLDPFHRALRTGNLPVFESFNDVSGEFSVFRDAKQPGALAAYPKVGSRPVPANLSNQFLIGHPDTLPELKPLLQKLGVKIEGDNLSYSGSVFSLKKCALVSLVDLPNGERCAIGVGTLKMTPNSGHAWFAIVDEYGRILRAKTRFPAKRASSITLR